MTYPRILVYKTSILKSRIKFELAMSFEKTYKCSISYTLKFFVYFDDKEVLAITINKGDFHVNTKVVDRMLRKTSLNFP